jgi:hypothetical protein
MRKLAIGMTGAVALLLAGILAWNAQATTLTSAASAHPATNFSLVEKAGCWLPGLPGECDAAASGSRATLHGDKWRIPIIRKYDLKLSCQ